MKKCITMFFGKGKWLNKTPIQGLREEALKHKLSDNDLALVKVYLDEHDEAIIGKTYYCNRCGLIIQAKLENCPRCGGPGIVEGKPTLEWLIERAAASG